MNRPAPVPRPSKGPVIEQWSSEDLAAARRLGRDDLITAAQEAGQLADLLERGATAKAYDHSGGTNSRVGGTMTPRMAEEYLRTKVPPPGASEGTIRAYTEQIEEN